MLGPDDDYVLDGKFAVEVVLVDPVVQVVERLRVRDVEHQNAAVRPAVVRGRQRSKPFLARRVPDL